MKNMLSQMKIENSTEINILNAKINEINVQYKNKIKEADESLKKLSQITDVLNTHINENGALKQKINSLEIELSEKDKKIIELIETNKLSITTNQTEHLATKSNTNALTNEINLFSSDLDVISYKKIEKGYWSDIRNNHEQ